MEARRGGGVRDKKVLRYKIRDTEGGCLLQDTGGTRVHDTEYTRYAILLDMRYVLHEIHRYKIQIPDARYKINNARHMQATFYDGYEDTSYKI